MYDELVKRLRERAGAFDYDGRPDIACDYEQAADAIEELSGENESLAKSVNEASEILRRRWIPVTERLPEKFENVLVANKRGKHYDIDKGWWNGGWWNGSFFDRCAKGSCSNVTHWMPLPEPPKEE